MHGVTMMLFTLFNTNRFHITYHFINKPLTELLIRCHQWRTQEFCSGGGSTNSVEDSGQRERGSGGGSPLVRGSGGSCNLVQISFHEVKFS